MTTTIEINGLKLRARHGVAEQERTVGNDFEVTVHLRYPIEEAMSTDDIACTLNYAEVAALIRHEMSVPSRLLEHVAGRIRRSILSTYPAVVGGMIRVAKPAPPMGEQLDSVAVSIEW